VTLKELLTAAADEIGAKTERTGRDGFDFRGLHGVFASVAANGAEFALGDEIAEAALRTPATTESSRGRGWVRLEVSEPTEMDLDRARAWFLSAWRAAES
jgi:hypothetical protein